MKLALSGRSALIAWRALRADKGFGASRLSYGPLPEPDPSPALRLTQAVVSAGAAPYYQRGILYTAVPSAKARIRTRDVECVVHAGLPADSYWDMGEGIYLPRPELLFVEMGAVLSPLSQLLLGMELCGGYARPDSFLIPPACSASEILSFIERLSHVEGLVQSRMVAKRILDGAWSPMEAVIAHLMRSPFEDCGYGFDGVELNPRVDTETGSRVPDILIKGTNIGINYEGEDHFNLGTVAAAAAETVLNPQSAAGSRALEQASDQLRSSYVDDRRRDGDLMAEGYVVFPVTKEDLYERGGLDRVMRKVLRAMEKAGMRGVMKRRELLNERALASERQLRIWSMLPGKTGDRARAKLAKRNEDLLGREAYVSDVLFEDGTITILDEHPAAVSGTLYL